MLKRRSEAPISRKGIKTVKDYTVFYENASKILQKKQKNHSISQIFIEFLL